MASALAGVVRPCAERSIGQRYKPASPGRKRGRVAVHRPPESGKFSSARTVWTPWSADGWHGRLTQQVALAAVPRRPSGGGPGR